jgi:hemerythrin-like metal-binding protein
MSESLPIRLPWSKAHRLGCPALDDEHELLAAALANAQLAKGDALPAALADLRTHWIAHQSHEEQMMRALAFPELPEHLAEHIRALAVLDLACETAQTPEHRPAVALLLRDAIPRWLNAHLAGPDAAFAAWIALSLAAPLHAEHLQPAALT